MLNQISEIKARNQRVARILMGVLVALIIVTVISAIVMNG